MGGLSGLVELILFFSFVELILNVEQETLTSKFCIENVLVGNVCPFVYCPVFNGKKWRWQLSSVGANCCTSC